MKRYLSIILAVLMLMLCWLPSGCAKQPDEVSSSIVDLAAEAIGPEEWLDHLNNDLLKFWTSPDATQLSNGLFDTYLSNNAEAYSPKDLPKEIVAALETEGGKSVLDFDENYVRAHSRQTYAYGIAFHMTGNPEYLELCRSGSEALQAAFDPEGGMYTKKNRNTGDWDTDRDSRTSQDLSYGICGMAMYYYLTRDPATLESIIAAKDYIFDNYFDESRGYMSWYPKNVDNDQAELVGILDQLYSYMVMLTPILPEPYKTEWTDELKLLADNSY